MILALAHLIESAGSMAAAIGEGDPIAGSGSSSAGGIDSPPPGGPEGGAMQPPPSDAPVAPPDSGVQPPMESVEPNQSLPEDGSSSQAPTPRSEPALAEPTPGERATTPQPQSAIQRDPPSPEPNASDRVTAPGGEESHGVTPDVPGQSMEPSPVDRATQPNQSMPPPMSYQVPQVTHATTPAASAQEDRKYMRDDLPATPSARALLPEPPDPGVRTEPEPGYEGIEPPKEKIDAAIRRVIDKVAKDPEFRRRAHQPIPVLTWAGMAGGFRNAAMQTGAVLQGAMPGDSAQKSPKADRYSVSPGLMRETYEPHRPAPVSPPMHVWPGVGPVPSAQVTVDDEVRVGDYICTGIAERAEAVYQHDPDPGVTLKAFDRRDGAHTANKVTLEIDGEKVERIIDWWETLDADNPSVLTVEEWHAKGDSHPWFSPAVLSSMAVPLGFAPPH